MKQNLFLKIVNKPWEERYQAETRGVEYTKALLFYEELVENGFTGDEITALIREYQDELPDWLEIENRIVSAGIGIKISDKKSCNPFFWIDVRLMEELRLS